MKKQYKYQVGDLVELSSAGRKIRHNCGVNGMIGLIQKISEDLTYVRGGYPYVIGWLGYDGQPSGILPMKEYEIKRVRTTR